MYDDIEIRMDLTPSPFPNNGKYKPFEYKGINFVPDYNNLGVVGRFKGNIDNIRLEIEPQTLILKNSIHKYYMGNNFSDYTLSDVFSTVGKLIYECGIDIRSAEVKKLAYAVNIPINNPDCVYPGFVSYLTRPFNPMKKRNRTYGTFYTGADFKIKCYNKTRETQFHYRENTSENILRLEAEINNLRHLHIREKPIQIYTFRDLYNYDIAVKLTEDLINKYRRIYKNPNLYDMELTTKELRLLALFSNPEYLDFHKNKFPDTYKKDRKKITDILKNRSGLEIYDEFEEKIITKCRELLSR